MQQQRKPREAAVKYYPHSTFIVLGLARGGRELYVASESLLSCISPFFAVFEESMTLNLSQGSFKVIHFGGNRKPVYDFRRLIVAFALSSTVSEILPSLYA